MESKVKYIPLFLFTSLLASCQTPDYSKKDIGSLPSIDGNENTAQIVEQDTTVYDYQWLTEYDYTKSLFNNVTLPEGYYRDKSDNNSFASWLRHLPIKSENTVYLYNGEKKYNQGAQFKVVDIDVGNQDLQQCADAVMRLRAEYLFSSKQMNNIHFNYTNGTNVAFSKWSSGFYPSLKGNKVVWVPSSNDKSYNSFRKYMTNIFMYAGTSSLEKELKRVTLKDIKPGDVFIKGGFPGHAVIVIDVVINKENNDKCFMIAQSYMPAQNIHILKNPNSNELSPWYSITECADVINTPEWTFYPDQLKRFEE